MIREMILIYKIWRWHEKQFSDLPSNGQQLKLDSEIFEYVEAKQKHINSRRYKPINEVKMLEEMSDVIIAGINCLKYPDFYERVAVKHNINTHRTWKGVHHDVSAK